MERKILLQQIKSQMTEKRFRHTLGVAETAVELAKRYGENEQAAELAGLLHDYCKCWEKERMQAIMEQDSSIPSDLLSFDKELWHAHVGAFVVKEEFKIEHEGILAAIRYHTSGRKNMSLLEKIVWLADYMEPNRQFPEVEEVRKLAILSLEDALIKAFGNTIAFLANRGKTIYPLTVQAYNDLIDQKRKNGREKDN